MHLGTGPDVLPDDLRLANLARIWSVVQGALIHDLKGPLNAATLELDLLRQTLQKSEDAEQLREAGVQAVEAVQRELTRLNDALGSVAPLPDADVEGRVRLDPAALTAEAVRLARQRAIVRGIHVELSHPETPVEILGQRGPLLQATIAVLLNALAATPPGGNVRIVAEREGEAFRIGFEDSGTGFAPDDLEHGFEPHYSGNGGPGLGLTVARAIVEEHGGAVVAGNGPVGAIVEISLPIAPAGEEE